MKKCKMKQLALAVGVALGGMSLVPSVQAVNLATDGLGQVLIFPYYTTRGGWITTFNITNTSSDVVALKVRFHESRNSRDVFDFNVIMSGFDVWNGWVEGTDSTPPIFKTEDQSCTVPRLVPGSATGQSFDDGVNSYGSRAYTLDAEDGGGTTPERMTEGYVEVIMMGTAAVTIPAPTTDPTPYARAAIHGANGIPANCQKLVDGFTIPALFGSTSTAPPTGLVAEFTGYSTNPLKGFYTLVNGANSQVAGGSAVTLANFRTAPVVTMQLPPDRTDIIAPAAAFAASFHEPSLNAATTTGTVLLTDNSTSDSPTTIPAYQGVDNVGWLLLRDNLINQWTKRTAATGWITASDWVITHPTKAFYVDRGPSEYAAINPFRGDRVQVGGTPSITSPFASYFANVALTQGGSPTQAAKNGKSCNAVTFNIWDREEKKISNPVFSPAPVGQNLCYEVNVLTFANSKILGSSSTITNNIATLPGDNGWMALNMGAASNLLGSDRYGLPVIGFSLTTRDTGDGNLNEAFLIDHSYTRTSGF